MPAPPRRRWLRYSLSTLLLLLTALAIWLGIISKRARDQREAITALTANGCQLIYDYQITCVAEADGFLTYDINRPRPSLPWLAEHLGEDYFFDVVGVADPRSDADPTVIASAVKRLPNLRLLSTTTAFDFEQLQLICKCSRLEELRFNIENLTNEELQPLEQLQNLQALDLNDRSNTRRDDVLRTVGRLRQLRAFGMELIVSQSALAHLEHLTQLEHLWITIEDPVDINLANILSRLPGLEVSNIPIQIDLPDLGDDQRNWNQAIECVRHYERLEAEIQGKLASGRVYLYCAPTIAGSNPESPHPAVEIPPGNGIFPPTK